MELIEVEILTTTITGPYGTLAQGDILRTSPEFARHLVKDAFAGKYVHANDDVAALADDAPNKAKPAAEGQPVAAKAKK